MFDVGFSELVVIGLIALLVLGPKRLPEVARTAGKWVGRARRFIAEVKQDFDVEMHKEELAELRKLQQDLSATRHVMEDASGKLFHEPAVVPSAHAGEPTIQHASPSIAARTRRAGLKPAKKSTSGKKHGASKRTPGA